MKVCQCCNKEIKPRELVVKVSYGFLSKSNRFYIGNRKGTMARTDYFHKDCDKCFLEDW